MGIKWTIFLKFLEIFVEKIVIWHFCKTLLKTLLKKIKIKNFMNHPNMHKYLHLLREMQTQTKIYFQIQYY